jgi:hypothetical protein
MADLSSADLADLRIRLEAADKERPFFFTMADSSVLLRLVKELIHRRIVQSVGRCPHEPQHAGYCAGCCAEFDSDRMILRHQAGCLFRAHERRA